MVLDGGGTPSRDTTFPIAETVAKYPAHASKALAGAAASTQAAVAALRPWPGGDDDLSWLHRLDIDDKHKLLIQVAAASRSVAFGMVLNGKQVFTPPFLLAEPESPLYDGIELGRIAAAARGSQMTVHPTFTAAFGPGTIAEREALVPTVQRLVDHVDDVVQQLIGLLP